MAVEVILGDITKLEVDAIVNAANSSLLGGGGVDGAIHRAAGPELLEECRRLGGCKTGDAKISKGWQLPAKFVIHAVGPVWRGGVHSERELLRSCYQKSLELVLANNIKSVAFSCISTGVYRFPREEAAKIAISVVSDFLQKHSDIKIIFCCFLEEDYNIYQKLLKKEHDLL